MALRGDRNGAGRRGGHPASTETKEIDVADTEMQKIIADVRKDGHRGNDAAKEVGKRVRDVVNKRENTGK